MPQLVPIPWQPTYYLTPDTLALLVSASARLNTELRVTDAWRSYAEQKAYYDAYRAGNGPIASDPDTGQRNHMRGAAFDLARTDADAQAACRAVGLVRDPDEAWHWNNPRWASMPIIPTNPDAATVAKPTTITPRKRVRMFTFIRHPNGTITLINGEAGTYRHLTPGEWAGYQAQGAKYAQLDAAEFDGTIAALRKA